MEQQRNRMGILAPAQRELEEIALVHLKLAGAESARRGTNSLYSALQLLQTNPNMGVDCKDKLLKLQGFRMLICGHYIYIYRVLEDTVYVYHLVDGRVNYPKLLTDLIQK